LYKPTERCLNSRDCLHHQPHIGLAISDQKIIPRKTELTDNWFVPAEFRLFRGTENSWNSVQNHFAEEKNVWNSVTWNKNRRKLSELCSKSFHGREPTQNSETKKEVNSQNSVQLSILFAEARFFVKPILFTSFSSVPGFGIDSSLNLGMPS
jgi:hypothetical protein